MIKLVDARLLEIRLPDTVNRTPRSLTERKYWKGKYIAIYYMNWLANA